MHREIVLRRRWAGAVRFANAHISDDEAVAKMGRPALWLKEGYR